MTNPEWSVQCITQAEYASGEDSSGKVAPSSCFDGQVQFVATFNGLTKDFHNMTGTAHDAVMDVAKSFGEISAHKSNPHAVCPAVEFRVEYFKISAAKTALKKLTKESPETKDVSALSRVTQQYHR